MGRAVHALPCNESLVLLEATREPLVHTLAFQTAIKLWKSNWSVPETLGCDPSTANIVLHTPDLNRSTIFLSTTHYSRTPWTTIPVYTTSMYSAAECMLPTRCMMQWRSLRCRHLDRYSWTPAYIMKLEEMVLASVSINSNLPFRRRSDAQRAHYVFKFHHAFDHQASGSK